MAFASAVVVSSRGLAATRSMGAPRTFSTSNRSRVVVRAEPDETELATGSQPTAAGGPEPAPATFRDPGYVSTLDNESQALWVAVIAAFMVVGTNVLDTVVSPMLSTMPFAKQTSRLIGVPFILAGIAHFTAKEGFVDMYPDKGAWGLWFLPGSPTFHVYWTGVAEILGGIGVMIGDLPFVPAWVGPTSAQGLFLLTAAVTPSNIFMFTHDKLGPAADALPEGETIPWWGHLTRLSFQPVLLAILWNLAKNYHK